MTRSTPATYDDDFFAWTQAQAAALRRMPRSAVDPEVDIDHVAEEIEDLGKRDLREVTSLLTRLIEHLIKLAADRSSRDRAHWAAEAVHFQASAVSSFSPSMRRLLDIDRIWRNGRRAAARYLAEAGVTLTIPEGCPLSLDFMLDDAFDMDAALARMTGTPAST